MFPLTGVPFWAPMFDPQPSDRCEHMISSSPGVKLACCGAYHPITKALYWEFPAWGLSGLCQVCEFCKFAIDPFSVCRGSEEKHEFALDSLSVCWGSGEKKRVCPRFPLCLVGCPTFKGTPFNARARTRKLGRSDITLSWAFMWPASPPTPPLEERKRKTRRSFQG